MTDKTPAEKAAAQFHRLLSKSDRNYREEDFAAIIQAAIDEATPKWREIETMPKDGTQILLWNSVEQEVHSAFFNPPTRDSRSVANDEPWGADHEYSHWMPRPQPPEDAR